jgi:hypothetical protein
MVCDLCGNFVEPLTVCARCGAECCPDCISDGLCTDCQDEVGEDFDDDDFDDDDPDDCAYRELLDD